MGIPGIHQHTGSSWNCPPSCDRKRLRFGKTGDHRCGSNGSNHASLALGRRMTAGRSDDSLPAISPDQAAFKNMADLLKLITGLATGSLVFSVGLLSPTGFDFVGWVRTLLAITWLLLFLAVLAGVWAQSLLPLQIKKNNYDINARDIRGSAMAMEVLFLLGTLGLAIALIMTLLSAPSRGKTKVASPIDAVKTAMRALSSTQHITSVGKVELVKGAGENRNANDSWHVQLLIRNGSKSVSSPFDLYIDPTTSRIYSVAPMPSQ